VREPAVRAHFLKLSLAALERCEPALQDAARQRLSSTIALIDGTRALSWLPIEHLLAMNALAEELGGRETARRVVLDTMALAFESPLWGRLVRATIAGFGLSPQAAARWAPPFYRLAFRATGRMRTRDVTHRSARVVFERVPERCLAHGSYVRALAAALAFFFELTGRPGEVELAHCDPAGGVAEFRLTVRDDGDPS
jgi:hypothetical protein